MSGTTPPIPSPDAQPAVGWVEKMNAFGAAGVTLLIFLMLLLGMAVTAWKNDIDTFKSLVDNAKALGLLAAGFWLGSSKSSRDQNTTISAIAAKTVVPASTQGPVT